MNITHKINDSLPKLIGIPLLAVLFPNISGLIINNHYSFWLMIVQYLFFTLLMYILWQGNIMVVLYIKRKIDLDKTKYNQYIFAIIISTIVYAFFIVGSLLLLWTTFSEENKSRAGAVLRATFLMAFVATFITIIYENYLLNRKKVNALSKVERMGLAKAQAELSVLKSQMDPHFIFNSLNTLSYLISSCPENAKLYNDTLANVYHYILNNRERDLVLLREEMEFISNYFYLLRIRFDKAISMIIEINNIEAEELLIPPLSLQILVENAMKHNEFDNENPLLISVYVSANQIVVNNKIHQKSFLQPTCKVGLDNLENRYRLITNRSISIDVNKDFTVKLPLINLYG